MSVTVGLVSAATPRIAAHADLLQEHFQRAEVGEGGLQQVHADERREPEPIRTVIVREEQTRENEDASEAPDEEVNFHGKSLVCGFNESWSR